MESIGVNPELWEVPKGSLDPTEMDPQVKPKWRALSLVKMGVWCNKEFFPRTRRLFDELDDSMRPYEVLLARLPPRTKFQSPSDNMNFLLAGHLPLSLGDGDNAIHVGEWTNNWTMGEMLVFDETYKHSAVNDSGQDSYILVCRFFHPDVNEVERYALLFMATLREVLQRNQLYHLAQENPDVGEKTADILRLVTKEGEVL
eukprot:gnl/TRDRNA2_/TRDRNA2_166871_c2_seq3.p1 gnl/TRDRNA2_/TRDRNA2_166871_c2~~gnl/TRDRNA2_/TRDRNA2_166871_c2_seq3.p1  ORF type:complete len:201 (+),score=41.22 gnl/TRDRNA2_/TRDRNA2_166871_c2_seq3:102-704(+)